MCVSIAVSVCLSVCGCPCVFYICIILQCSNACFPPRRATASHLIGCGGNGSTSFWRADSKNDPSLGAQDLLPHQFQTCSPAVLVALAVVRVLQSLLVHLSQDCPSILVVLRCRSVSVVLHRLAPVHVQTLQLSLGQTMSFDVVPKAHPRFQLPCAWPSKLQQEVFTESVATMTTTFRSRSPRRPVPDL